MSWGPVLMRSHTHTHTHTHTQVSHVRYRGFPGNRLLGANTMAGYETARQITLPCNECHQPSLSPPLTRGTHVVLAARFFFLGSPPIQLVDPPVRQDAGTLYSHWLGNPFFFPTCVEERYAAARHHTSHHELLTISGVKEIPRASFSLLSLWKFCFLLFSLWKAVSWSEWKEDGIMVETNCLMPCRPLSLGVFPDFPFLAMHRINASDEDQSCLPCCPPRDVPFPTTSLSFLKMRRRKKRNHKDLSSALADFGVFLVRKMKEQKRPRVEKSREEKFIPEADDQTTLSLLCHAEWFPCR
ncbi:hypothetical protein BDP55DRAFT_352027 [Colletotrichum godetiae]|uniref:Uncharacterized protein n=1 Tax=Colletotrichum godetiae TaxID=1209918 RepID=A0AAJ0AWU9_9PEZI|nr:uncharacterized protein BDP55DRAFT_352027 [Colletotrichum godetiae]KAK1690481.1 hypothetical protein BDP55DRAFT_352027 [Colletotrichum godetiae]